MTLLVIFEALVGANAIWETTVHSSVLLLQLIKPPITKAKRFEFVNVPFAFKQVCKKAREMS